MKKLLHIIATPRDKESRTLKISGSFLDAFRKTHKEWIVEELNLSKEKLPDLTLKRIDGKYVLLSGADLDGEFKKAWKEIVSYIEEFVCADAYLISTPMWNFGIPYTLKQYIDVIMQPKFLFRYTETGPEGLVKNKKMVVIMSRGGDYTGEKTRPLDFQEPYLRSIFGLAGITDINFIVAQPMDIGLEIQGQKIKEAQVLAEKIAASL